MLLDMYGSTSHDVIRRDHTWTNRVDLERDIQRALVEINKGVKLDKIKVLLLLLLLLQFSFEFSLDR